MLSDNAMSVLDVYIIMIDNAQNFSDQVAIKCILDYDVYHNERSTANVPICHNRPAWHNATDTDICHYKLELAELLSQIAIPAEAVYCTNLNYNDHSTDICKYYDCIILVFD